MKKYALFFLASAGLVQPLSAELFSKDPEPALQVYMNGERGDPTPPASPQLERRRLLVTGDFLWWIARENLLEYAFNANILNYTVSVEGNTSEGSSLIGQTTVKAPDFQWDPGFRVGIGYRIPHDYWEAKARWTRFHTNASGSSSKTSNSSNENIAVYNDGYTWGESTATNPVSAKWSLDYDLLEIGLSRSFFLGKNLSLDMQFGVAGGWIDQDYDNQVPALAGENRTNQNFAFQFSNNFSGGGLFLSMAPQWTIWKSLSILGNMNAYLLRGQFDIDQNWFNNSTGGSDMSIHKDYARNRAGLAGKLGVQWETFSSCHKYHFILAAAYEGTIWFKQNLLSQVMTFYTENFERRGDLEMQGLTFSARADF